MKNSILISAIALLLLSSSEKVSAQQGVSINSSGFAADNSAMLDVQSDTVNSPKGLLIPRMSTAKRNTIVSPATGLIIYNLDCKNIDYYDGSGWTSVNPAIATVNISANPPGAVCSGTNITFTASPVFGGTSPVFQWKVNGSNVGTNSSVYSGSSLSNGDQVCCVMTSNAACASGSPVSSNTITMIITQQPTITGTTPGSRNGTGTVTLGANASVGTINWYPVSAGGSSLGTGTSFITPYLCATTTYYVDATNNGCVSSPRTAVTATLNKLFQVDNGCSLTNGLVSYWKLEANSNDFFSTNNGTDYSVSYSTGNGKVSQGAYYNGSSGYASIPDNTALSPSTISLSFWMKPAYIPVNLYDRIIDKRLGDYGWHGGIKTNAGNSFYWEVGNGATITDVRFPYTFTAGTWYHIVITQTGTSANCYINGTLITGQAGSVPNIVNASGQPLYFGRGNDGPNYNGSLDEIGIWNKVLSTQEISDLYNNGSGQTMQ